MNVSIKSPCSLLISADGTDYRNRVFNVVLCRPWQRGRRGPVLNSLACPSLCLLKTCLIVYRFANAIPTKYSRCGRKCHMKYILVVFQYYLVNFSGKYTKWRKNGDGTRQSSIIRPRRVYSTNAAHFSCTHSVVCVGLPVTMAVTSLCSAKNG